jgi:hypothetical protein
MRSSESKSTVTNFHYLYLRLRMKHLLCVILLIANSVCLAQTWTSPGNFTTPVFSFGEKGTALYAGCTAPSPAQSTSKLLYKLNNGVFDVENSFTNYAPNGFIMAIKEYNGELYLGGSFTTLSGPNPVYSLAKENGGSWTNLGTGFNAFDFVFSLEVYKNKLYAAGIFTNAGGVVTNGIAAWDGSSWSQVGGAGLGAGGGIYATAVFNNELYVAGTFTSIAGVPVNNIAKWNDSQWFPAGIGLEGGIPRVTCLEVYKNELYAGGDFQLAAGDTAFHLARWSNNSWKDAGIGTFTDVINDMEVYKDELYVTGHFSSIVTATTANIARYNGIQWSAVGQGVTGNQAAGSALISRPEGLYVGGRFEKADNITVSNVARWEAPVGLKEESFRSFTLFPNPAKQELILNSSVSEDIHFSIYDTNGKLLCNGKIPDDGRIDIDLIPAGVFLIRCTYDSGTFLKRFVVVK